jgi:hypothetical protein
MQAIAHNENGGTIETLVNIASLVLLLLLLLLLLTSLPVITRTALASGWHLPRTNVARVCCLQGRRSVHSICYFRFPSVRALPVSTLDRS